MLVIIGILVAVVVLAAVIMLSRTTPIDPRPSNDSDGERKWIVDSGGDGGGGG